MKPIHYTVSERIVLHLLDFIDQDHEIQASIETTQQGISECICVKRKHIPRALKKLREQGLIIEKKCHIPGKKQMLRSYRLTDQGRLSAIRCKNDVIDKEIPVFINGEKSFLTVSEAYVLFDRKYSIACILSQVTTKSFFDENDMGLESGHDKKLLHQLNAEEIYKKALAEAWKDGVLTIDERNILRKLRETLHISNRSHYRIQRAILHSKQIDSGQLYRQIYDLVLTEVLKDNKISKDEEAILERLKKHFNISDDSLD